MTSVLDLARNKEVEDDKPSEGDRGEIRREQDVAWWSKGTN